MESTLRAPGSSPRASGTDAAPLDTTRWGRILARYCDPDPTRNPPRVR